MSHEDNEIHNPSTVAESSTCLGSALLQSSVQGVASEPVVETGLEAGTFGAQEQGLSLQHGAAVPQNCVLYQGVSLLTLLLLQVEMFMYFGGQDSSYNCCCLRVLEGAHKKTKANLACHHFGGFIFGQPKNHDCE